MSLLIVRLILRALNVKNGLENPINLLWSMKKEKEKTMRKHLLPSDQTDTHHPYTQWLYTNPHYIGHLSKLWACRAFPRAGSFMSFAIV